MKILSQYFGSSSVYWGERGNWPVAMVRTRDSDLMSESNWVTLLKRLGVENPNAGSKGTEELTPTIVIEEASHWACGWIQYLLIAPTDAAAQEIAETAQKEIADYPVLDETDWGNREYDSYYLHFAADARFEIKRELKERGRDDATNRLDEIEIDKLLEWFESCIPSGEYHLDEYPNFGAIADFSDGDIQKLLDILNDAVFPLPG